MAKPRQPKPAPKKPSNTAKKMVTMDKVMARRLAALAAWQGRSESSIVCELLRPVLADVAVTGGPARPVQMEPTQSPAPAPILKIAAESPAPPTAERAAV